MSGPADSFIKIEKWIESNERQISSLSSRLRDIEISNDADISVMDCLDNIYNLEKERKVIVNSSASILKNNQQIVKNLQRQISFLDRISKIVDIKLMNNKYDEF